MQLAMVGLGKMGFNMSHRLLRGGHQIVGFAHDPAAIQALEGLGGVGADTLQAAVNRLGPPRIVWLMIPAGNPTSETVDDLTRILSPGDIVIDGGNSYYKDSIKHAEMLSTRGIEFVDCGTSGGVWGLDEGYSMMIGGKREVVESLRPIFETLAPAPDQGWGYVGPSGAGHYVKMVHNGIEYGMMEAFAEGFSILKSKKEFELDLHNISKIWQRGSVVRSWLLDLAERALETDPTLSDIKPWVEDSGEGRWTVFESIDMAVPAPIITLALQMRFVSRDGENYTARMLSALRNQFGGHAVKKETDPPQS